jgi:iron complex outermembrane receptor protein
MSTNRALTNVSAYAIATVWVGSTAAQSPEPANKPDSEPINEVIVTGIRQSLASAQAIKQNAEQIVDTITAEDIGRFPDTNIAESLQRISGIQIERNLGEGSNVAIRGLTQVRTELNGHDIFTANGGVGLSFDEVGPDLLSRVDVFKNPSAEMIEGSLGGTIDLRTRKPFDADGRVISMTPSYTYYDLAEDHGEGVSGLYSDRWDTGIGEFGLLLNASYQTSAFRQDLDQVEPYLWHGPNPDPDGAPVSSNFVPGHETENILVPKGGGFNVAGGDRARRSYSAAFQWRPSDSFEAYAQVLAANYAFRDTGLAFFATEDAAAPIGPYVVEDGVAVAGALASPSGLSITYAADRHTQTTDYNTGFTWNFTDRAKLVVDYQHIDAYVHQESMNLYLTPYSPRTGVTGLFTQDYNYLFDTRGKFPTQLSSDPTYFSNPANYGFTAIQPNHVRNDADGDSVRADLTWDFDDDALLKSVSSGVRYSKKTAINRETNLANWTAIGNTCANWSSAANCYRGSDFPEALENNPGQATLLRGRAADSVFGPILQWRLDHAQNPALAFADVLAISGQVITFGDLNNPRQATTSTADETDSAAYLRAAVGSTLGNMEWDGNIGVRYVRTEASGQGFEVLSYRTTSPTSISVTDPLDGGSDYNKLLPSLNLRLHITPSLQARFAFSQNIFRPSFTQLNPTFTLSPNYTDQALTPNTVNPNVPYDPVTNPYQGSGSAPGNPNLKPEQVTSFDVALEWYFARDGFASLTVFKKDLKDIIDSRPFVRTEDIPDVGVVQFNYNAATNVTEGYVRGFEIGGQTFFNSLPGALSGLGVAANYTLADSNAGTVASGNIGAQTTFAVPLMNLSRRSYNVMALYDHAGWNARIAYNWRDKYLNDIAENGAENLPIYFKAFGVIDASVSYDFNDHFSVTVDGQNLNDAVNYSYQGEPRFLRNYQINDRRFSVRMRWRN